MKLSKASMVIGGFLVLLVSVWIAIQMTSTRPSVEKTTGSDFVSAGDDEAVYLLDKLPFDQEEVRAISVQPPDSEAEIEVPDTRRYVILQNLAWLNMKAAAAQGVPAPAGKEEAKLRFQVKNETYELPYDLGSNTIEADGRAYYADDQVYLLVNELLRPDSQLAELENLLEQARAELEQEEPNIDEAVRYEAARLLVDGKDYEGWRKELEQAKPLSQTPFYSDEYGKVQYMRHYEKGVYEQSNLIIFMSGEHRTKDDVYPGLTRQQVLDRLGKPNLQTETLWSYMTGENLNFFLYFNEDQLSCIALRQPN